MDTRIQRLIEQRSSTNFYDTGRPLPQAQMIELVRLATLSPSAYNFQNWRFIAVHSPLAKARLKGVAHQQQKVVDAPVTFIISGLLGAHESLARALQPSVEAGVMSAAMRDGWVAMAAGTHPGDLQLQRDEAVRSASLAAMTLMLAAEGMGLASGAMGGFDAAGVAREFGLAAHEVPVMLVTVGHPAPGNWPQKPRKPVSEVMAFA
jgi:nitroreductase